jgi:hypothetical protein
MFGTIVALGVVSVGWAVESHANADASYFDTTAKAGKTDGGGILSALIRSAEGNGTVAAASSEKRAAQALEDAGAVAIQDAGAIILADKVGCAVDALDPVLCPEKAPKPVAPAPAASKKKGKSDAQKQQEQSEEEKSKAAQQKSQENFDSLDCEYGKTKALSSVDADGVRHYKCY